MKKSILYETNTVAFVIEAIAWLELIISIIILTITFIEIHDIPIRFYVIGTVCAIIVFVFIYSFGELIQIVHDIRAKLYSDKE